MCLCLSGGLTGIRTFRSDCKSGVFTHLSITSASKHANERWDCTSTFFQHNKLLRKRQRLLVASPSQNHHLISGQVSPPNQRHLYHTCITPVPLHLQSASPLFYTQLSGGFFFYLFFLSNDPACPGPVLCPRPSETQPAARPRPHPCFT